MRRERVRTPVSAGGDSSHDAGDPRRSGIGLDRGHRRRPSGHDRRRLRARTNDLCSTPRCTARWAVRLHLDANLLRPTMASPRSSLPTPPGETSRCGELPAQWTPGAANPTAQRTPRCGEPRSTAKFPDACHLGATARRSARFPATHLAGHSLTTTRCLEGSAAPAQAPPASVCATPRHVSLPRRLVVRRTPVRARSRTSVQPDVQLRRRHSTAHRNHAAQRHDISARNGSGSPHSETTPFRCGIPVISERGPRCLPHPRCVST